MGCLGLIGLGCGTLGVWVQAQFLFSLFLALPGEVSAFDFLGFITKASKARRPNVSSIELVGRAFVVIFVVAVAVGGGAPVLTTADAVEANVGEEEWESACSGVEWEKEEEKQG